MTLATLNPNWRLAWSDEFNTLDTTKWNLRNKPGNYGNGELQWYHPNQTSAANGYLVITAIKQAFGGESYMSSWLDTQDKAVFTYGRYEVRAKMAGGKGIWPAMWILSQNKCWASGAETDIAEFRGAYPTRIGTYYHYASQCCTSFTNCISSKGSEHDTGTDLTANYHVYALEWYTGNMTWYVDDVVMDSYQTNSLTVTQDVSPHYWIINNAIGGGYPGNPDSTTVFPNYHSVDYVRNYVWRQSCAGETCSGNGCCNPSTVLCVCNAGFAGASCEQNIGSATVTFDAVTSLDNIPNGWGNPYTLYLTANTVASNGAFKFTLTNAGCPGSCGNVPYSSGAWESIPRYSYGTFIFQARSSSVSGTGLSLSIAGESAVLEQIAFTFVGGNRSYVQLWTWTGGWPYKQADIPISFDPSSGYHYYGITWGPSTISWSIDGTQVKAISGVSLNAVRLGPGAYYTADPDWYGTFKYRSSSAAYLNNFAWTISTYLFLFPRFHFLLLLSFA